MGLKTSPRYVLFVFYNSFFSYDYLQVKATHQNTSRRDHHHHYDQIRRSVIHDEGEDGGRRQRQGLKTYLHLEPWYVFFFPFFFFYKHLCTETIHTATTSTMHSNPGCSPPPLYGVKEVGVKEVGMKGARDADASRAPGISTCTGSLISVE